MATPKIKVQIVDDEKDGCFLLENLLSTFSNVSIVSINTSPLEGLNCLLKNPPDILFLDMNMPVLNGIKFLKRMGSLRNKVKVIAVSGHVEYAIEAIQENIFDYLLKPPCIEDMNRVFGRISSNGETSNLENELRKKNKFVFRTNNGADIINLDEIVYVEADKNYSYFFLSTGTRKVSCINLGKLETMLPASEFIRISRKYIINLNLLDSIDTKKKQYKMRSGPDIISLRYSISLNEIIGFLNQGNS